MTGAILACTRNNNTGRVLAFYGWLAGTGKNIIVVVSLSDANTYTCRIGFQIAVSHLTPLTTPN